MHADPSNPYSAPAADLISPPGPPDDGTGLLRRWERLRLVYNGILLAFVAATVGLAAALGGLPEILDRADGLLAVCVVGCLGANVCFCLGPVANAYANWLGLKDRAVTIIIFVLGVLASIPLAVGTVAVQILGTF